MNLQNPNNWYVSSTGQGLSLTIKGLLIGLIPAIIAVGKLSGVDIAESDLTAVIEAVTQIIAGITILIGFGRKAYKWIQNWRANR